MSRPSSGGSRDQLADSALAILFSQHLPLLKERWREMPSKAASTVPSMGEEAMGKRPRSVAMRCVSKRIWQPPSSESSLERLNPCPTTCIRASTSKKSGDRSRSLASAPAPPPSWDGQKRGPDEPTLIDSWNAFLAKFGNFTWGYNVPFAVYNFFAEGGAYAYVVSAKASDGLAAATVVHAPFQFTASSPGLWGNDLAIAIENYPWEDTPSTTLTPTFGVRVLYSAAKVDQDDSKKTVLERLITRYIKNNNLGSAKITRTVDYYVIEEFPGLTIKDLKKGANGQPSSLEAKINGQSLFLRVTVNAETPPAPTALAPALLVTGADSTSGTPVDYQDALARLDPITDASLLVMPDTGMLDDLKTQQATIQQGINYCEGRTPCDMFVIADAPFWLDPPTLRSFKRGEPITPPGATAAIDLENALNSDRGAIYYPWIDFFNTSTARSITILPPGPSQGPMPRPIAASACSRLRRVSATASCRRR